jgi:Tfp pilus assembly protein PilF
VSCARDPQERAKWFAARGDDFARSGKDAAALIEYRNAVREAPAWAEVYQKLGGALERLGRTRDAYRAYAQGSSIVDGKPLPDDEAGLKAIVERRPQLVPARIALAERLLSRNDSVGAEEQLRAATAAEPGNEMANRALAALYIASGRSDRAESCLEMAAAHEPQRYRSRLALADFLLEQRRYAEARSWLEQARRDATLDDAVTLRLAAIDYEEGRGQEAQRAVARLLGAKSTAEALTLQAQFRLRDRKPVEALASASEALAINPRLSAAQDLVEEIRRQGLQPESAPRRR